MATTATTDTSTWIADWFRDLRPASLAAVAPDPAATAIFSADMIGGFVHEGPLASARVHALAAPVTDLFRRARAHGVRDFVLLQDTHHPETPEFGAWPVHAVRGMAESATIPELRALPFVDELVVIEKNSLSPAIETGFDRWLDGRPGLRTAIVVGNCTDLCVYQLAMHLRMRANARNHAGLDVVVPANAVDTYDLPPEAAGNGAFAHPGEFFHQTFLYHMALNGVRVVRELT